ncbi:MAG: hypothetical protein OEW85_03515 [Acidimicrobiia bacterium]|nr:hypothetical protein [Acidimicrobiia bacterium]
MKKRVPFIAVIALVTVAALSSGTASAHSERARGRVEVARGQVVTLAGGQDLGYDISGHALMMRTRHRTFVAVHVRGLDVDTTYPAHVHNAPCSATTPGGGHYQHEIGGPVDAVNEIWPTVTTNHRGRGWGHATHDQRARPDAMSIVIHYPPDTSIRLACVDLT